MQYFPINIRCADANIAVIGGDADVVAKIRLLLKTDAHITVFAEQVEPDIRAWHAAGKLAHCPRLATLHDLAAVRLAYVSGADTAIRDAAMPLLDQHFIMGAGILAIDANPLCRTLRYCRHNGYLHGRSRPTG